MATRTRKQTSTSNSQSPEAKTETAKAPKKPRKQRTPEQIVADLEAEIARVKKRAATKKAKQTEHGKALFAAAKALDKATAAADEAGQEEMRGACESARAILSEAMLNMGLKMPAPRRGKGGDEA